MWSHYVPSHDNSEDENGYIVTAKKLATEGTPAKHLSHPLEFVSGNWVETKENTYYVKYPLGYPFLCAIAYKLGGASAVFLVNPILATLGIIGIFLLGRLMINDLAGVFAAVLLATHPVYALFGLCSFSHAASTCFWIWSMFFIWKWSESGGWVSAASAGLLTAYAITVRYTDALLLLPLSAMVIWRFLRIWRTADQNKQARIQIGKELFVMFFCALLTITPLLVYHTIAFGSPWTTGYSFSNESNAFAWTWFSRNWELLLRRMGEYGMSLLFPLGLLSLFYHVIYDRKRLLFLSLWIFPTLLLYTSYYGAPRTNNPLYIRFFLPIFPALILGTLSMFQKTPAGAFSKIAKRCCVIALVLLVAGSNFQRTIRELDWQRERLAFTKAVTDAVQEKIPPGSVIFALSWVLEFTEHVGDYTFYSQHLFLPDFINNWSLLLQDHRSPDLIQRKRIEKLVHLLGNKTEAQLSDTAREIFVQHLKEGRKVFVILPNEYSHWKKSFENEIHFERVKENIPEPNWMPQSVPPGKVATRYWSLYALKLKS